MVFILFGLHEIKTIAESELVGPITIDIGFVELDCTIYLPVSLNRFVFNITSLMKLGFGFPLFSFVRAYLFSKYFVHFTGIICLMVSLTIQ